MLAGEAFPASCKHLMLGSHLLSAQTGGIIQRTKIAFKVSLSADQVAALLLSCNTTSAAGSIDIMICMQETRN